MLNNAASGRFNVSCQNNGEDYNSPFAEYVDALRYDVMPSYNIMVNGQVGGPHSFSVANNN
jgi:hypothetical protein